MDFHRLQRLLWNFADHQVIIAAGRTGLLRRLAAAPASLDEVVAEVGLDPLAGRKVMEALCALEILHRDGECFAMDEELVSLFREGEDDIVPFFEHSRTMAANWGDHLQGWLVTGVWPSRGRTLEEVHQFGRAMQAMGRHTSRLVAQELDLTGVRTILDLGGGLGHFAKILCENAEPFCRATVVDHPNVARAGTEAVAGTPWAERLRFVGGDYTLEDGGGGYDLVLLANVLHQELPPRTTQMIANAARAAAPGGRVAVVDFAIDDIRSGHRLGTLFAINMRSIGDTWTEPEIRGWMEQVGLGSITRTDLGPDRWLIQGRRSV